MNKNNNKKNIKIHESIRIIKQFNVNLDKKKKTQSISIKIMLILYYDEKIDGCSNYLYYQDGYMNINDLTDIF